MKTLLLTTAAFAAAVVVFIAFTLPPRRVSLPPSTDGTIAGILHVHTNRSDGLSGPDEIAAAAARAGLRFVVFTDHGDATRAPDPPTYRSGVLCLEGVEISTTGGHYVAIDMRASPFPLGGEPRDVAEDVRRLGGFGIVAHPDSPKPQLQWRAWDVPFDGIELLNPDTSWRVLAAQPGWSSKRRLVTAFIDYPFRAPEVMASLIQPTGALTEWERAARRRRVVTIAGADAHAKLAPRSADPGDSRFALPLPGYEASFRVMSVHVRPGRRLTGDAATDAATLMRAIRNGHLYVALDGLASPPSFELTATNALGTVHEGDELAASGPLQLHVRSNAPRGFTTVVHDGARTLASTPSSGDVTVSAPETPGVYWAEIVSPGAAATTWIRSNPVYVRGAAPPATTIANIEPPVAHSLLDPTKPEFGSRLELPKGRAEVTPAAGVDPVLNFRVQLDDGPPTNQAAALVFDTPTGLAEFSRLLLRLRADRPMRLSIQLRSGAGQSSGERWIRSVYLDPAWREYTIALADMTPAAASTASTPPLADIRSVMLVVDLTNTKPGFTGTIAVREAALQR